MGDKSKIEWTEATWNPTVGCSVISPGCTNCYAMKMAARLEAMATADRPRWTPAHRNGQKLAHYADTTKRVNGNAVWTGKLALAPDDILLKPLSWKRPRRIFVNSMSDLFHESVPDEWIDRVFAVMALAPQHTFQVLTKRAERMRAYLGGPWIGVDPVGARVADATWSLVPFAALPEGCNVSGEHPIGPLINGQPEFGWRRYLKLYHPHLLPNVWLGVSAEDQTRADERIPHLLETPAAVRFVSAEPLLGAIELTHMRDDRGHPVDWIIVGGESGPNARPMHPDWARSIRDQCQAAGVPFFFKQWGEYLPVGQHLSGCGKVHGATAVKPGRMKLHYAGTPQQSPKHAFAEHGVEFNSTADGRLTFRVGKRAAGRLLDGREHNEMPERDNG
jgi:protein gp37